MHILMKVCFSAGALLAIMMLAIAYDQSLFDYSLTYIAEIQDGASDFKIFAWEAYSTAMLYTVVVPTLVTYPFPGQRGRCFYYIMLMTVIGLVMAVLKLHHH